MKKRTNIYLDEDDKRAIAYLKKRFGITSESDVVRFALRKVAREEGLPNVSGTTGEDRQNKPDR